MIPDLGPRPAVNSAVVARIPKTLSAFMAEAVAREARHTAPLQVDHLPLLDPAFIPRDTAALLQRSWDAAMAEHKRAATAAAARNTAGMPQPLPSFARIVARHFGSTFAVSVVFRFIHDGCNLGSAFLLRGFIDWINDPDVGPDVSNSNAKSAVWVGYGWGIACAACALISMVSLTMTMCLALRAFEHLVGALPVLVFDKMARTRSDALQAAQGRIMALHTTESGQLTKMYLAAAAFTTPVVLVAYCVALYEIIGYPGLITLAAVILFTLVQVVLGGLMSVARRRYLFCSDKRLQRINEMIQGMRLCKFMGWEGPFTKTLDSVRATEISALRAFFSRRSVVVGVSNAMPSLMQLLVFGLVYAWGDLLTAREVFPVVVLLSGLRDTLMIFALAASRMADFFASMGRFAEFLALPEHSTYADVAPDAAIDAAIESPGGATGAGSSPLEVLSPITFGFNRAAPEGTLEELCKIAGSTTTCLAATEMDSKSALQTVTPENVTRREAAQARALLTKPIGDGSGATWTPLLEPTPAQLRFEPGTLTAIVGATAAGKSTLLLGLAGEGDIDPDQQRAADPDAGADVGSTSDGEVQLVRMGSAAAIATQDAWIANATVRENVTLGLPLDPQRYVAALAACQLLYDLDVLPGGDLTEIGERGVNVSGGQKQRIALARAVYSGRQLVLLDDPLSAVDPHVAGALFHGCIRGALAGRTRVLVTHQTQFLPHCDRVIVMEHGFVAFDGTYAEFVAFTANRRDTAKNEEGQQPVAATAADVAGRDVRSPILASGLLPTQQDVDGDDAEVGAAAAQVDPALEGTLQRLVATGAALRGIMSDMQSCAPETKPSVGAAGPMSSTAAATSGSLIQAEEMARGAVPLRLYVWYATRSGFMWPVAGVFLYLLWRAGAQISDMWASLWGSRGSGWGQSEPYTQNEYMKWFVLASGLTAAVFVFRQTVYVYWVTNVASAMHHEVVVKVLAAPMSFFDTTPTGRIMNRFSKDIEAFDVAIPDDLDAAMSLLVNLVGFVVGAIVGVWFIFPLFLLAAVILVLMIRRFGAALRAARRIENVSRSPMLAILTETMGGLRTMRIYGQTQRFSDRHAAATASMLRAVALFRAVQQWSMLRVSCISCVLVLGMGCLTAAVRTSGGIQSIIPDASYALLGLTYMMSLPTTMVYFIGQLPVLEAQMNASERIKEWMDELPQEPRIKYHNGYGAAEERAVTIPTGLPPPPPHKAAAVGHHATEPIASHDVALVAAASDSSPTTEPIELKPVTAVTVVGGDPFAPMPAGHEGADLPAPPRSGPRPPAGWPASGDLRFENVHLRYRPGLPLILRGVTCHIRSGMKVGVVGRTGSGKSTLLLALFRMVDACWGRVLFDGVDTRQLQLSDLRSQMTIIPQEPLLFAGTVRSNLDPFARCSDAQLWEVLDLVGLRDRVMHGATGTSKNAGALSSARGQQTIAEPIKADEPSDITNNNNAAVGLDAAVVEKGANFSVGQRQLMCLARALLKPSRLLLLDEATASVDQATDKLVQRVLRSGRLDGTTVVTIAHRLATIIDADRVLVMDAGRVAEFDHPSALLRKEPGPGAIFRSMVERLGPAQAAALAAVADGHASVDGIDAGASVYQE